MTLSLRHAPGSAAPDPGADAGHAMQRRSCFLQPPRGGRFFGLNKRTVLPLGNGNSWHAAG